MNFKKIVATVAAAALAVSAMAISTFAAKADTVAAVKLDSQSEDNKTIQWPITVLADFEKIDNITVKGTASVADWCGGGGAVGFDSDSWKQVDFALDGSNVTLDSATGEFTAVCEFGGVAPKLDKEDGLVQIGWWWGSGDQTMQLTDVLVNGTSILGKTATAVAPAETTEDATVEAPADETAADDADEALDDTADADDDEVEVDDADVDVDVDDGAADEDVAADDTVDTTEDAPAADADTSAAATGNASAAAIAAVMAAAGVAAIAAKKRK